MLRTIRIVLATIFILGLTLLFLDFTGTAHHWLGWMAKVQALEAVLAINVAVIVVLAVLTLVFGRIYCSAICPLGIVQDFFGLIGKKVRKNRYTYSPEVKWLRYAMLAFFLMALVAGIGSVFQLLAPYSAFGRMATLILQPLWKLGNNVLADMAERADSYAFYSVEVWMKSLPVLIIAVATLVLMAVLAFINGRTYCNTVCPVGTVLSLLSRYSLLKIQFDKEKCKNCSLCTKNCKAACIDFKNHQIDYSRCVVCGDCLKSCKFGALKYSKVNLLGKAVNYEGPQRNEDVEDPTRRSFILATALVTTAALAQNKHVDGGLAAIKAKQSPKRLTPLAPPGALSLQHFAQHCTGCQLCVSKCPNDVLRPSVDLSRVMLPEMAYDRGYCRPECTLCSQVCPAGAIKPIDRDIKPSIQIGLAVVVAKECLSAKGETECSNCERHCPKGAISLVPSDPADDLSPLVPAISDTKCTGCGACEYVCPVRPLSAIHVEGIEVHHTI